MNFNQLLMLFMASAFSCLISACDKPSSSNVTTASDANMSQDKNINTATIMPENWPIVNAPDLHDADVEARIEHILSAMTIEEKVGQVIQADIASIEPGDLLHYRLGSILNGGNSAPGGNNHANPSEYLALADAFYEASINPAGGAAAIPIIWGTDAVHGHSNIVGATLFPHNIGLGAARDRDLIREIGDATAREVQVTGMDWTFAPTLAVVRDDRWGRSYEGYSEDPEIVHDYASAMIEGIQGTVGTNEFLSNTRIIATAKHFLGDGGTFAGVDQGDNQSSEEDLRVIHGAGYPPSIEAGVQTVMASFSGWHGEKLHGHKGLLTDVLIGRLNFDGFVVGDWNGHGQVDGCSNTSCAQAFNAGLDMFMAPDSWRELYDNTLLQVKSGEISQARLDQAVGRILRVKIRYGLFERGLPSSRNYAGDYNLLGNPEHRDIARRAVRQSLVLLKNNEGLLPLDPNQKILIAGDGADNIAKQSGGWSITWQGEGNKNADFPNGQSIYSGLNEAIEESGGKVILSEDGNYTEKPDVAIVVFGEDPYAEFQGDRKNLNFDDGRALAIMKDMTSKSIPVVAVFLSGRPMYVNPEINAATAFVAAWLPGSEGGGIADVLLRDADKNIKYDFTGKLSFSWPRTPWQTPLNHGDENYDPLFAYGFGLTYNDDANLDPLDLIDRNSCLADTGTEFIRAGRAQAPYRLTLVHNDEVTTVEGNSAQTDSYALSIKSIDRNAQEDARELTWNAAASFIVQGVQQDLRREANARMVIQFSYAVISAPAGKVQVGFQCAGEDCNRMIDLTEKFSNDVGAGWKTAELSFDDIDASDNELSSVISPFMIKSDASFSLQIADVKLAMPAAESEHCLEQ